MHKQFYKLYRNWHFHSLYNIYRKNYMVSYIVKYPNLKVKALFTQVEVLFTVFVRFRIWSLKNAVQIWDLCDTISFMWSMHKALDNDAMV